uniref:Small ribosomal subunit protein uS14c n=1 Tax=Nitzschia sp. PL1-4 TaxID=2083272 RepID=A0A2Z5ZAH0_9STRA|nr:ribosomal protein S14 [Nitzschia sp. PL1-4]
MAKKSMIEREKKRLYLEKKFSLERKILLLQYKNTKNIKKKIEIALKIQKLPRDSSKIRIRNRCWKTGRPRGFLRDFGLSRHVFRNMAHQGLLPGIIKSSW